MTRCGAGHSRRIKTVVIGAACLLLSNTNAYESSCTLQNTPTKYTYPLGIAIGNILGIQDWDTERIKMATKGLLDAMIPATPVKKNIDLRTRLKKSQTLLQELNFGPLIFYAYGTSLVGDNWCMRWWVVDKYSEEPRAYVAEFARTGAQEVRVYPEIEAGLSVGVERVNNPEEPETVSGQTIDSAHLSLVRKLSESKTRIIVDNNIFEEGALEKDITGRRFGGRYAAAGDMCNLEKCDTSNADDILRKLRAITCQPQRTIVQVSNELGSEGINRLRAEAPEGVRFMRVDTNALDIKYNRDLDNETRWKLRFDLYAMLLAARDITGADINLKEASPVYRTMLYFLETHNAADPGAYIAELAKDNVVFLIKHCLSFFPTKVWSKGARQHLVSIRYISGSS